MKGLLEAVGFVLFIFGVAVVCDFGCNDRDDRMTFIQYITGQKDPATK